MITKQIIVIRRKYPDGKGGTTGLRRGKEIAQACHASMAFITRRLHFYEDDRATVDISKIEEEWLNTSFAKVCLQVDSEEELLEIAKKAEEAGLECHVITDSGRTEFNGVPTKTCLALGPDVSEKIDQITGHLKLY